MESHPSTAGVSKYMSSLEITPCMRHTYCMPFDFAEKVLYLNRIVTFLFLCFSDLAWIWRIDSRTLDFQFEFSIKITRENLNKKMAEPRPAAPGRRDSVGDATPSGRKNSRTLTKKQIRWDFGYLKINFRPKILAKLKKTDIWKN